MSALRPETVIRQLGEAAACLVAYSGGRDSRVLLELLVAGRHHLCAPLKAVHIHHGLHPEADTWERHCRTVCARLDVPLHVIRVQVDPGPSPEARARAARYRAFAELLQAGEVLLTAHHRDDQAETVLLRLLRGSGIDGLAAMPRERRLGAGRLMRPLLDVPRQELTAWAEERGLAWVEDPSNADTDADRNFLRAEILPRLQQRWPVTSRHLCRLADDAADAGALLDTLAGMDGAGARSWLDCDALERLPPARARNLFRSWIRRNGLAPPERRRLNAGLGMLLDAGRDRQPALDWPGGRVRRYRQRLYLDDGNDPPVPEPRRLERLHSLDLPGGRLEVGRGSAGLAPSAVAGGCELRFVKRGVRIRPAGRPGRPLSRLFQERGIPPWLRSGWPLLMADGQVLAVPGICVCEGWQSAPGEAGVILDWKPSGTGI